MTPPILQRLDPVLQRPLPSNVIMGNFRVRVKYAPYRQVLNLSEVASHIADSGTWGLELVMRTKHPPVGRQKSHYRVVVPYEKIYARLKVRQVILASLYSWPGACPLPPSIGRHQRVAFRVSAWPQRKTISNVSKNPWQGWDHVPQEQGL